MVHSCSESERVVCQSSSVQGRNKMVSTKIVVCGLAATMCLLLTVATPSAEAASISLRMPRSVSGILKRLLGRRKEQGYAQYQGPSNYAAMNSGYNLGQASYQYPQYAAAAGQSYPSSGSYGSYGSNSGSYGSGSSSPYNYQNYAAAPQQQGSYAQPSYGQAGGYGAQMSGSSAAGVMPASQYSAASSNYASYQPAPSSTGSHQGTYSYPQSAYNQAAASSSSNLDLHQVLDALVRSAGLAPVGDQEAAASTISAKGDTPVFSFKKLYSFPFYLSSGDQAKDSYQLHIPFMKKHIRRRMATASAEDDVDKQPRSSA